MQQEAMPDCDRMAARVARHDWAATPLGPIADWPQSLKTAVDLVLAAGHAMQLAWGPQCTVVYNDAYVPLLGDRHPGALGAPLHDAWPDRQGDVRAMARRVFAGEVVQVGEVPLRLQGDGGADDRCWTLCASPVRGESGVVAGVLVVAVEATARIVA